tara:strand:+ start:14972 stop:15391 length:420 start_codon:yes stop_codon:yes gene_type:complete
MKIYFAGAIRGGRDDAESYEKIIKCLTGYGDVLTEHVGEVTMGNTGEKEVSDKFIFERDIEWLGSADCVVAEVTVPSLGVGYEIGIAEKLSKPVLCLYHPQAGKRLSAMIRGNRNIICCEYESLDEAEKYIKSFMEKLG